MLDEKRPFLVDSLSTLLHQQTSFPLRYRFTTNHTMEGIPFHVGAQIIRRLEMTSSEFVTLTNESVLQFVFGTAASSNHFEESLDAIASVQTYFPTVPLYYYDLGLEPHQINQVLKKCISQ